MRATLLLAILSAGTLSAEERMNVSVCNLGNLPESRGCRRQGGN